MQSLLTAFLPGDRELRLVIGDVAVSASEKSRRFFSGSRFRGSDDNSRTVQIRQRTCSDVLQEEAAGKGATPAEKRVNSR